MAATDAQVATWAAQAGWPKDKLNEVVATSYAESGHDPAISNGLMQISDADAARYGFVGANVNDPVTNLRIAKKIYDVNHGWGAFWGTWPGPGRPTPQNNLVKKKLDQLNGNDGGGGVDLADIAGTVITGGPIGGAIADAVGLGDAVDTAAQAAATVADIAVTMVKVQLWLADPHHWWRVLEFALGFVALGVGLWQLGAIPEGVKSVAKKVPEIALMAA